MLRLCALTFLLSLSTISIFSAEPFIVHEWGVYVRSQAIVFGAPRFHAVTADNQPIQSILSCPNELITGLPEFVKRHASTYVTRHEERAWNKPVVHLYGAEGLDVSVEVKVPQGQPLAYYPMPTFTENTFWFMGSGVTAVTGMQWKGKLSAQAPEKSPAPLAPKDHWWNTARSVPGMWLKTAEGTERFIFYEATAVQAPVIVAKIEGKQLKIENTGKENSGPVLVLLNDGVERHFLLAPGIEGGKVFNLSAEELKAGSSDEAGLLFAAREQWEAYGMTKQEAAAIVEIWKPDLLEHIGVMVLSRMPSADYENMFPLTVTPAPEKLVRAGLVIDQLPGDAARIEWLPKLEQVMTAWAKDLGKEDFEVRSRAVAHFAKLGDLAKPFVEKMAKSDDPEVRTLAEQLLSAMKPAQLQIPNYSGQKDPGRAGRAELQLKR